LNEVSIDTIIQQVTQEVVRQLQIKGVTITSGSGQLAKEASNVVGDRTNCIRLRTERIDLSKYKTPVLTERHIDRLHELTGKIVVPHGTIITPRARETAKRKQIFIETE